MRVNSVNINSNKNSKTAQQPVFGLSLINAAGKNLKNNIKIVFSDIDGTISKNSDYLTDRTKNAINYLQSRNIPVVLITARCYNDTLPIIDQFERKPEYTIVLQGGGLIDKSGKYLYENSISSRAAKNLVRWFKSIRKNDKNSHLILYFNDQPYSLSKIQFPWKTCTPVKNVNSYSELFDGNMKLKKAIIYKTDAYKADYNSNSVIQSFNSARISELDINSSGSSVLEFQNKWVSKDKAIDFLLRALKISPQNAMVIGDSANDIPMFDFLRRQNGLAVAMGNADSIVKKHANAFTSDVNNDGFANAIEHLFDMVV